MNLKILDTAHHRNGISGAPFHVVLFEDQGPESSRKVAVLFADNCYCAVLDVAKLAAGDIAFGSNSWRGDQYEASLRRSLRSGAGKAEANESSAVTNESRASRCEGALTGYSEPSGPSENLIDLLTDAMHWCRMNGHDFAAVLATAAMHFEHETTQQPIEKGAKP